MHNEIVVIVHNSWNNLARGKYLHIGFLMYNYLTLSVIGCLFLLLSQSDGFILRPGFRQVTRQRVLLVLHESDNSYECESGSSKPTYTVFRKHFHIPARWAEEDAFKELAEHRYEKHEHISTFDFIESRLKKLNYHSDNRAMVHDYLHFLICDMLDAANVPYITEQDIKKAPALTLLLNNKTPDLIVEPKRPHLPLAIDVFAGDRVETVDSKKEKYKSLGMFMAFDVVTFANLRPLSNVLSQEDLHYIQDQVAIFMAEYQYWHACLKLKKILFNDIENVPIRVVEAVNTMKKVKLLTRLEKMSQVFSDYKNGVGEDAYCFAVM